MGNCCDKGEGESKSLVSESSVPAGEGFWANYARIVSPTSSATEERKEPPLGDDITPQYSSASESEHR